MISPAEKLIAEAAKSLDVAWSAMPLHITELTPDVRRQLDNLVWEVVRYVGKFGMPKRDAPITYSQR